MPIPPLLPAGLLPDGIHECTVDELVQGFGAFNQSDQRPRLVRALEAYISELQSAQIGKYLIVDGSFVTDKSRPSDVDLLLVLKDDLDLRQSVPPFKYNPRSKRYLRKRFDFDFAFGFDGDATTTEYLSLYRKVKGQPGAVKGYLKVVL